MPCKGPNSSRARRILDPTSLLAIEVFSRAWQWRMSSGDVAIEVAQLRPQVLVNGEHCPTATAWTSSQTSVGRSARSERIDQLGEEHLIINDILSVFIG